MAADKLAAAFKKRNGYAFKNDALLFQALTHSSLATTADQHNERLEFLGDRVLALVIAEELYSRFPTIPEGEMARRLNAMVRKETCADVARQLDLGTLMQGLDRGKGKQDIFNNQNVLGDACEAVLAAIYLDSGLAEARQFILKMWNDMIEHDMSAKKDPKSALQEWALGKGIAVPVYTEVSRQGPDHGPTFVMSVEVEDHGSEQGTAPSKRAAEQNAATAFLKSRKIEF